jgi:dihydroorotate dehydrogenase (fumarate)
MTVDLKTIYLGLELKNPLVIAACPLSESLDNVRRLEEAGASAVVFHSLFEEQIAHDEMEISRVYERGTENYAEALSWFPETDDYRLGPEGYLEQIENAKKKVKIPVIGSLNGVSKGGWIRYAKLIQESGADALELNIYLIAADMEISGEEIEARYTDLVAAVKQNISIPLAVKVGPYFSSPGHMAKKLVEAGADGLVLFNRFLQPDIDLEAMEISPHLVLSTPYEALLPLRWIAMLYGRVHTSLALTSGIHDHHGLIKALMAGADVGMVASVLYKKGFDQIGKILLGLSQWMTEKEYDSVAQLKGSMSQENCPHPEAFERGNYMKALTSYTGELI